MAANDNGNGAWSFVWNDGGRTASGFVGLAGDCVTRSIAIATGTSYRAVYEALGEAADHSPRSGMEVRIAADYLESRGWQCFSGMFAKFDLSALPRGVVIVHLERKSRGPGHFSTIVDHIVHDTWNPADEENHLLVRYWVPAVQPSQPALIATHTPTRSAEQELSQQEFEKILRRLRALDNTASNDASTEGERHNALRMMQSLMLRHNLSREDMADQRSGDVPQFTRIACPVNGKRLCGWEGMLAQYVTTVIFRTVQCYTSREHNRTLFWFYGTLDDVKNAIELFRELLLTIATSATLQYGSYSRGSGASYAEGYVSGLPRTTTPHNKMPAVNATQLGLIERRELTLKTTARKWLDRECGIRLYSKRSSGRNQFDPSAAAKGKHDGASHKVDLPNAPKRIGFRG